MSGESLDPDCLKPDEAARLLAGHPWRRLVVLGDSVANGPFHPVPGYPELRWTDRVAAELTATAPTLAYRNLGVVGLRVREVRLSQLAPAMDWGPDLAVVVAGGNDAFLRSYPGLADTVDGELVAMIEALQTVGTTVLTVGLFDVSFSPAVPERNRAELRTRLALLAGHTAALAQRYGTVHVDLSRHRRASDPTLYSPDGRHGNARSDAIAAAETVRALAVRVDNPIRPRALSDP